MTGADKPKPTVFGRAEDEIVGAEQMERRGDMAGTERRDIGPDEYRRTRRAGLECAAHADTEIPAALAYGFDPVAPMSGTMASLVRGHGDPQMPAPVRSETAEQQRDHQPLEAHRRDIADFAREPALARPQ